MAGVADKVAVITGASRGIGFGIAQEFIEAGATVVLTDLDQAAVEDAAAKLGDRALGLVADVTNLSAMTRMYAEVAERYDHIDAVVANAGVGDSAPLGEITEEQFDYIFGVNTKGVLFTVQAALPHVSRGATFVLIGSTASTQSVYGMSVYGGSKAAIRQFVRTWLRDLKGSETGIRICVLSPGAVDTPSLRIALAGASGADKVQQLVEEMGEGNPIGRLADPREIGKAAVFLSNDASSYVHGVELFVDGGLAQVG